MTGLLNKRMFNERSSDYIKRQIPFSILMIDLNDFKSVNDTFSHVAGDEVIIEMGKRLKTLKGIDNWVYRFGGDEFLVFSNFVDKEKLSKLARDIIGLCNDDIEITGGSSIHISLSVGISSFPEDSQNIEELIIDSDSALYDLKEKRVIGYGFFEKDKYYLNVKMNKIKIDLDQAIQEKRIYMVFQPVVDVKTEKIIGFESLMRIKDFKYGPDEFIPVAEKTGLIDHLGLIALKEAMKFLKTLKDGGFPNIKVSVNFSSRQLDTTIYESIVAELVDKYQINIRNIVAEITESLLLEEGEKTKRNLMMIKKDKIDLALDDFGCGYSSIRALSRIDFNTVKFDKELIDTLTNDKKGLKNLVEFVHGYGCQIVAEGVETKEQVDMLKDLGCEYIQGYYYGRPMVKEAAIDLLKKNLD